MIAAIATAGGPVPTTTCDRCGEFCPHNCAATAARDYVKWVKSWYRGRVVLDRYPIDLSEVA